MEMAFLIGIILALTCTVHGRVFNNPILEGKYNYGPGVIKVNGTYYIARSTNSGTMDKFQLHTSTDLKNWTDAGFIFNQTNLPVWSLRDGWFWSPEIHKIGENFVTYFSAQYSYENYHQAIGFAVAPHPLGPYVATDRPLLLNYTGDVKDPTIINDNGTLYLLWTSGHTIKGRPLNPDGLSFASYNITEVLEPDLPWEDSNLDGPWHLQRGDYHYLFYSGNIDCKDDRGAGVARSRSPLGPYEKRGAAFLVSVNGTEAPSHVSVIKDLDESSDVIVAHGFHTDEVCGTWPVVTVLASMGWSSDSWPYVYDF